MADLNVRSDSVNVEQIMKQIRTRIREKRGSDYTQAELQQLASAKLEQFADPSGLRHDLLEQFRKRGDEPSTYHRHRGMRRVLLMIAHPILKRVQKQVMSDLNLYFEIIHNLVVEVTRLGIEVQNLKMRVESLSSRVDFDERRAKALEGVVQYRPKPASGSGSMGSVGSFGSPASGSTGSTGSSQSPAPAPQASAPITQPPPPPQASAQPGGHQGSNQGQPGQGPRPDGGRRRRRRRRRRPGSTLADSPNSGASGSPGSSGSQGSSATGLANSVDASGNDGPDEFEGPDDGGHGDDGAPGQ